MRLGASLCALDRRKCAQVHVTTLKTHGEAGAAMVAKATQALRADEECARSLARSILGSLGLSAGALNLVSFRSIAAPLH